MEKKAKEQKKKQISIAVTSEQEKEIRKLATRYTGNNVSAFIFLCVEKFKQSEGLGKK